MLNEDATIVSEKIGLKITNLGPEITKCGFPISKIEKYIHLFNINNLKYEIIENSTSNNTFKDSSEIIKQIKNLDLSNITPLECFNIIYNIQQKLKE